MPNLATALKEEIARLARKELKTDLDALRKTTTRYRSEIAALNRQIADLEKKIKATGKQSAKPDAAEKENSKAGLRFRPEGFKTKREKLGLTADEAGKFFNVSGQTIYLWESKRTSPRANQMPAIAAFRKLGKKQAKVILEGFAQGTPPAAAE